MSGIKNRIITISGEPASGKSTVIDKLKKDYEAMGYKVHIFSVGHEFRRLAQERGLSVGEFNKFVSDRSDIDKLIDEAVAKRGEEINSKERQNEVFIFDSRLAFHNIPSSFSIRLTVDSNVAGQRVFGDNKRGKEDKYSTVEEATEQTIKRKKSEIERYLKTYGVNLEDPENYNLVIDTSFSSIEDISKVIEQCLELNLQGKKHGKMGAHPKTLLPTQSERQTLGKSPESNLDLGEWKEKLSEEGYDWTKPIKVVQVGEEKYIDDGHHKNIAWHLNGNSIILYDVIARDDEPISKGNITAKQSVSSVNKGMLWGHEAFFDKKDEKGKVIEQFSYDYVYPGIYKELEERDDWYR